MKRMKNSGETRFQTRENQSNEDKIEPITKSEREYEKYVTQLL
jgi:hypothetical protein